MMSATPNTATRGSPMSSSRGVRRRNGLDIPVPLDIAPDSGGTFSKVANKQKKRNLGNSRTRESIIPLWMVIVLCGILVVLGFAQQFYNNSSSSSNNTAHVINDGIPLSTSSSVHAQKTYPKNENNLNILKKSLLSLEEDTALEYDLVNGAAVRYHIIFSTDCSSYQHWQSYLVYFSAMKKKQPGHVTRIVSGCEPGDETNDMMDWFENDIRYMSPSGRFHIHLTPKFSTVRNESGHIIGDYKFFNKPYGVKHWMEHTDLLKFHNNSANSYSNNEVMSFFDESVLDDVVILIDPDMGLIRPIRSDFSNPTETIVSPLRTQHYKEGEMRVRRGHPFAQTYGFGTQWQRLDLKKVTGDPETPASSVTNLDGRLYYPVGPPYLATVGDMYNIAVHWSKFVRPVHEQYPHLLAEMFAYCIAAAHLNLPHILVDSLMVSDVEVNGMEGWKFIDDISPPESVCDFAYNDPDHTVHNLPNVFHMCQRYAVGEDWFFSKRRIPSDLYNCDIPLFEKPPSDLATVLYKHPPGGTLTKLTPQAAQRHTFAVCFIYGLLTAATAFHKNNTCPVTNNNQQQTRNLARIARAGDSPGASKDKTTHKKNRI